MRNDVSLWVAIALSVRLHSRELQSPMPIPCTGAWLSHVPRRQRTSASSPAIAVICALRAYAAAISLAPRPRAAGIGRCLCAYASTHVALSRGPRQQAPYRLRSAGRMFMFTVRSDFLRICCSRELVYVPIIISFQNF